MHKRAMFHAYDGPGWPELSWLEPYFLSPPGKRWFFESGSDSARFVIEGLHGTENKVPFKSRVDADLCMWAHPQYGVLLIYSKWGGGYADCFNSKGDMRRIREWVRTLHDDLRPVGLYIPFEWAWGAVKEFLQTDGKLPGSIEWIASRDLPPDTFPDP